MKIHSDKLTHDDLHDAAKLAKQGKAPGIYIESVSIHGSRSRARRFDVQLGSVSNNRYRNSGQWGAATWKDNPATYDDYGHWIAQLFHLDPDAKITYYDSEADFHRATDGKYELDLADFEVTT